MKFIIIIKYFYPGHSIGLEDVRNAWLISDNETPVQFKTAIHQEHYITGCRYQESESVTGLLKKGLVKKQMILKLPFQLLPF